MEAILDRRAVAVYEKGLVAGPPALRDALRILLLEQVCLEESIPGPVALDAAIEDRTLRVRVSNRSNRAIRGELSLSLTDTVTTKRKSGPRRFNLAPREERVVKYPLRFMPEAAGRSNLIGVAFSGEGVRTRALAPR